MSEEYGEDPIGEDFSMRTPDVNLGKAAQVKRNAQSLNKYEVIKSQQQQNMIDDPNIDD